MELIKPARAAGLLPEKMICALCGGTILKPVQFAAWQVTGEKTMARHLKRCRRASEEERTYFRVKRKWPNRPSKKREEK